MKQYDILLVEDDDATRARLARAVERNQHLRLRHAVGSFAEAMECLAAGSPDVLLTDLGLPDGNGVDLIRELKRRGAPAEALVITVFGDEQHVVAAIEAGATGYLLKDGSDDYIGNSILELLHGGSPISPAIARHLLKRFRAEPPEPVAGGTPLPKLTERERQVLELLVKGFTFGEIGSLLGISAHTVTSHVKHIYVKLEVRSRAEAVYEAMSLGLVRQR